MEAHCRKSDSHSKDVSIKSIRRSDFCNFSAVGFGIGPKEASLELMIWTKQYQSITHLQNT